MRFARYVHFGRLSMVGVLALAALARPVSGGVGVWTISTPPLYGAQSVVVGPDGAVYIDWGAAGASISYDVARSSNHGVGWTQLTGPGYVGPSHAQVRVLAIDSFGAIYAAFNAGGNAVYHAELSVSRDEGASWTLLLGEFETVELGLEIDPFASSTLYLLDGLGGPWPIRLRRSSDGGAHWTEIGPVIRGPGTQSSITAAALDPRTAGRMYAAVVLPASVPGSAGTPVLFASDDGGSTWTSRSGSLPENIVTLIVDPFQAPTIYGGGPSGILRSDDAGRTFVSRSVVPTVQIAADPLHAGRLYAATSGNGVLSSADGGTTWNPMNAGLTDLAVNAVALDATRGYLYAATKTGVFSYRFPDPGTLVLDAAHPFTITLTATDQRTGRTGPGVPTQVNDLWGYFSLPAITNNPNNPEVFVKMLDGTALNGSYWFFYGGLTDLEYTLTVKEDATGLTKTYTKPAGSECGGSDTAAFGP
jgi:photosystem II stability/assembly factor-like uncharacterized protein